MADISLLDNGILVQVPFVKVTIGDYIFGVFQKASKARLSTSGAYVINEIQYPNYIQSLNIAKINGQVNTYTLVLKYAVTADNDPNFFEKVFSSVSQTRKIVFSYGDMAAPAFLYKDEEAIITDVKENFDINSAVIQYNVTAVSSSKLAMSGAMNFKARLAKPSDVIKEMLGNNSKYGLQDVFPGMRDMDLVEQKGLIASDDIVVPLDAKTNISILEYLRYLVQSMKRSTTSNDIYVFKVVDDTTGEFNGPYFRVVNSKASIESLDTYELDIGYPSQSVVISFTIDNNEAYSIFYNYSKKLNTNEYVERISDTGELIDVYSPLIGSNNGEGIMKAEDENWWKNVTEYPISAVIKIKGVLRPAILMSKLRLKVYFYGKLHTASGLYIINKQVDDIGLEGCYTTLNLVRVGADNTLIA